MSLFYYGFSLFVGSICLILVYRLISSFRLSYLWNYFYFLLLTQVWGFILWILPKLVPSLFREGIVYLPYVQPVFTLAKWFGFPIQILHAYFLLAVVWGILKIPLNRTFVRIYFIFSAAVAATVIFSYYHGTQTGNFLFFGVFSYNVTFLFLFFELGILILGYMKGRGNSEGNQRKFLSIFFALYGFGYVVYLLFGLVPLSFGEFGLVTSYYALHVPPVIFLYHSLGKISRKVMFDPVPANVLSGFLESKALTHREAQIVELILRGFTNRDMGRELFISLQTTKNYVSSIYKKFNVKNRFELFNVIRNHISGKSRYRD